MATEVFAIGDCAVSGKPPTAQVAYQQGWDVWMSHVTLSFTQNVSNIKWFAEFVAEFSAWRFPWKRPILFEIPFLKMMRHSSSFFHPCRNSCLKISLTIFYLEASILDECSASDGSIRLQILKQRLSNIATWIQGGRPTIHHYPSLSRHNPQSVVYISRCF